MILNQKKISNFQQKNYTFIKNSEKENPSNSEFSVQISKKENSANKKICPNKKSEIYSIQILKKENFANKKIFPKKENKENILNKKVIYFRKKIYSDFLKMYKLEIRTHIFVKNEIFFFIHDINSGNYLGLFRKDIIRNFSPLILIDYYDKKAKYD